MELVPSHRRLGLGLGLSLASFALAASGCLIAGSVFVDTNGDGIRQASEPPVAGAVVALDRRDFTVTDANGAFVLQGGAPGDIVWARVPDGFRPGPAWTIVVPDRLLSLPLRPLTDAEARAPLTFVVAADTHISADASDPWYPGELADVFSQATDLDPAPRFFTVVGDLTQSNAQADFDRLDAAVAAQRAPWVPVAGNHDWYDEGATYRAMYGPDNYSFDLGDVHVIVWDSNLGAEDQLAFFADDLARVSAEMRVVALGHEPPADELADELAAMGVDYLFTGHWHANRRVDHGELTEWGTEPLIMGGIDVSPAGYRIVNLDGPIPVIEHRERMVRPQLGLVTPHPGTCSPPLGGPLVVAAALDGATPHVTGRVDCGRPRALRHLGGWTFAGELPALLPGPHTIELEATSRGGRERRGAVAFNVCAPATATVVPGAWPQDGGGAEHRHARAEPLPPPLTVRWSTSLARAPAAAPVVADGLVVIVLEDRAGSDDAAIVALDLATGAERWRHRTRASVVATPAIASGLVVVGQTNGEIEALDLVTGTSRWRYQLAAGLASRASTLWSPPTIAGGLVYVTVQGRLAALDLVRGEPRWTRNPPLVYPWLGSRAAVAVTDDAALVVFNRDLGLSSWDVVTGAPRWANVSNATLAINATPLVVDGAAYVVSANGDLSALDVSTGRRRWSVPLTPGGFDWGYSVTATPAYADGRLFIATQWNRLLAVDAATGAVRWQTTANAGPLNFAHYRAAQNGFVASPVVTGDVVWVSHPDGALVAHAVDDGTVRWSTSLGAPITVTPAPAGNQLIVATHDGTIRALAPSPAPPPPEATTCLPWIEPDEGCCAASRPPRAGDVLLFLLVTAGLLTRRRRRRLATRSRRGTGRRR
jgi:outer membrane protein assembly factor BamB